VELRLRSGGGGPGGQAAGSGELGCILHLPRQGSGWPGNPSSQLAGGSFLLHGCQGVALGGALLGSASGHHGRGLAMGVSGDIYG
jgi:hypothetical protein